MDNAILVGLIGLVGTFLTVIGGIIVAIITWKKEKREASETTLEKTLRERITLRDEQLVEKDEELEDLAEDNRQLIKKNVTLNTALREAQHRIRSLEMEKAELNREQRDVIRILMHQHNGGPGAEDEES